MDWKPLPLPALVALSLLGESPFWHPGEAALYWVDIPGKSLNRWHPQTAAYRRWPLPSEPGCCTPLPGGDLLLALRDGLVRFNPASGQRSLLAAPPYDPGVERYNDGMADAQGRLWVGTLYEPRDAPKAALYRWADGKLTKMASGVTVSNGLAFSPDGRTMLWSDTLAHRIDALDFDPADGSLSRRRVFAQFPVKTPEQALATYGGRPDGAAMDAEGCCWVAMFEGQRLVRLSPAGELLQSIPVPVRCPTMPCFGGPDLRTLYVTTARLNRPADELAAQPWAGCVLSAPVDVPGSPGLPVNFARA